jgi:hypothetical protein
VPVAHTCNSSYSGGKRSGRSQFKGILGKQFTRPYLENTHHKIELEVKALSSSPSAEKKKKKKK